MKEMKKVILTSMFAFLMIASMMFLPLNPASAQSSSWSKVSDVRGDSTLYVEYRTNDWDSSKKTCKSINLQITNKYSKALTGGKYYVKFKDTGREDSRGLTRTEAGKPYQQTFQYDPGKTGCIIEYVKFENVKTS